MNAPLKRARCPECDKALPWSETFRHSFGLPDKRELDCPYCGAPVEPLRWHSLIPLFVVLAIAIAAKRLIGPLLDWNTILILLALAAVYHIIEIRNLRRKPGDPRRPPP